MAMTRDQRRAAVHAALTDEWQDTETIARKAGVSTRSAAAFLRVPLAAEHRGRPGWSDVDEWRRTGA